MSKDTISSDRYAAMAIIAAGSAEAVKSTKRAHHYEWPGDRFSQAEIKARTEAAILRASEVIRKQQAWQNNLKQRIARESLSDNPTVRAEQIAQRGGEVYHPRLDMRAIQAAKVVPPFDLLDWASSGSKPLRRKVALVAGAAIFATATICAGIFSESTPNKPVKNITQISVSVSSR